MTLVWVYEKIRRICVIVLRATRYLIGKRLKTYPSKMSVTSAVSFRLSANVSRQVCANKTLSRPLYDALTLGVGCIANALPKAREVSRAFTSFTRQHLPTRQPADTPSRAAQHPSTRRRHRARVVSRGEDYALPPLFLSPPSHPHLPFHLRRTINVDVASWRDIPNSSSGIS